MASVPSLPDLQVEEVMGKDVISETKPIILTMIFSDIGSWIKADNANSILPLITKL